MPTCPFTINSHKSKSDHDKAADLEEGVWFVGGFLHGLEQGEVEAFVRLDVVPHVGKQDQGQEALCHSSIQVAHKKPGGLVDSMWAPILWLS